MKKTDPKIVMVPAKSLKPSEYNPRKWNPNQEKNLKTSIEKFGIVDPIIANSAPKRKNIVIGGHFRLKIAKELGINEVPVVYINIPDIKKEKEINLRLNKNLADWDYELLDSLNDNELLKEVGFEITEISKLTSKQLEDFDKEDIIIDFHRVSVSFEKIEDYDRVLSWLEHKREEHEVKKIKDKSLLYGKILRKLSEIE